MKSLKSLYSQNVNIQQYFREINNIDTNDNNATMISYDFQAGTYTDKYYSNKVETDRFVNSNGEVLSLSSGEFTRKAAKELAKKFDELGVNTILEVGSGESTTLCDIVIDMEKQPQWVGAIELSLSRLLFAEKFEKRKAIESRKQFEIQKVCGDMYSIPLADNSVELVFTYYCIDGHRGQEEAAVREMLRVSKDYIVLVEPSYELGNTATRERIDKLCYIKNLRKTIEEIDEVDIVEHRLFDISTTDNNAAIFVLKKKKIKKESNNYFWTCPSCKSKLLPVGESYFCDDCFSVYPVLKKIPILLKEKAVLCSKYLRS